MPKFRVKYSGRAFLVTVENFDGGESPLNLQQLKLRIATELAIDASSFEISLNGRDSLVDDGSSLRDQGVVPGDTLYVLQTAGAEQIENRNSEVSLVSSSSQVRTSSSTHVSHGRLHAHHHQRGNAEAAGTSAEDTRSPVTSVNSPDTASTSAMAEQEPGSKLLISGSLTQMAQPYHNMDIPLTVREATEEALPLSLINAYQQSRLQTVHDALIVVLDVLMVETGFTTEKVSLPSENAQGVCRLQYRATTAPQNTVSLVYITMASIAQIHLKLSTPEPKCQCQIKPADYVKALNPDPLKTYRNLPKLSRIFKDKVSYPAMSSLQDEDGSPLKPTLLHIAVEVQLMILSHLESVDLGRMMQISQYFNQLAKEPSIWKRLLQKDFKVTTDRSTTGDFFEVYKLKYIERKQRERRSVRFLPYYPTPMMPYPRPPMPGFIPAPPQHVRPVFPPGAIGGDFDRDPFFGEIDPLNPLRPPNRGGGGAFGTGFPRAPNPRFL